MMILKVSESIDQKRKVDENKFSLVLLENSSNRQASIALYDIADRIHLEHVELRDRNSRKDSIAAGFLFCFLFVFNSNERRLKLLTFVD